MAEDRKALKARKQAETRVSRVLRHLRAVGKMAPRNSLTGPQIDQMFQAIRAEVDTIEALFAPQPQTEHAPEFKFGA